MMNKVQQDIMCVLLQTLLDKGLITQDIHDKWVLRKGMDVWIVPKAGYLDAIGAQNVNGLVGAGSAANMQ